MSRHDQIVRILTVARALASSRLGVPLKLLAERHGWNLRSVYRDVEALELAGFQVTHEDGRFRILAFPGLPQLGLDTEELVGLFLARQLTAGVRVTSLGRALERLWGKLTVGPKQTPALLPTGEPPWLSIRTPTSIDYASHQRIIATVERSIRERNAVSCRYRALSTGEITARVIEPGELHWDPGLEALYLIAWCRLRKDVRVFAVHRFLAVTHTDDHFAPRAAASSKSALRHAFRVWRSAHVHPVRIRFAPPVADEIRERRWHGSQKLRELPHGAVELSCEVAGLEEVERWVLSWGSGATVVEPAELAERVAAAARGIVAGLGPTSLRRARRGMS